MGRLGRRPWFAAACCGGLLLATWLVFQVVVGASTLNREIGEQEPGWNAPVDSPTAAEPAAAAAMPNVIFIVVDALRADHVSSYGYERPTTPNLDALMAEGVRFEQTITASSWTFPSNGAMLTGRMPSRLNVDWTDERSSIPEGETLLAEHLHNAGYNTAGFVNNFYLTADFGFSQGFDVYETLRESEKAEDLNTLAMEWLELHVAGGKSQVAGQVQPLFLFLYYYDPHTWYDPPPPYDTLYDNAYTGLLKPDVYQHGQPVVGGEITPSPRDVEHLLALYDGEITYWDHYFGQMMNYLDGLGLLDNSIIIVTSDHGQMFGEHNKWVHRNSLYEEVLRVPMMLRYDGVIAAGHVAPEPVSTIDLTPTILDLVGLPVPEGLDGISLRYQAQGQPSDLNRAVYAEMESEPDLDSFGHWIAPPTDLRSVRQGDWKYIHRVGYEAGGELYELQSESLYEQEDVLAEQPEMVESLLERLREHFRLPEFFSFLTIIPE
jgi:arylsulfatase A-like enzyme